ncbi:hypothetical protein [Armatimonas rosea]|uniref:Ligand-binding sensor domain-containing protein n=1 Tax=Armatimonas rosea TaxID=685828 RepID=A0A7W9SV65_ARMRO|nr:hypothetical protein [Armatimonas rosea]MBB6052633.1 ligand-binding sensor domain-containing protein [Armatimonas rosea]
MRAFTSTRDITALHALPNGSLRIETSGGVLQAFANGKTQVLSRQECLPTRCNAPLPPRAHGAVVTACLPDGLTAVFGDSCLWQAQRPGPSLPTHLRAVTALARWNGRLVIGVRRQGAWVQDGPTWRPLTQHESEPTDHNIQALTEYQKTLYASTLDQGLVTFDGQHWSQLRAPLLSSDAPRQLLIHGEQLLVRHGDGQVDRLTQGRWERAVFKPLLPRPEVSALASDGRTLIVLQWGGFSRLSNGTWTHHFDLPALRATPLTCALLDGERLWLGTQGKGLYELSGNTITRHDERHGLPDDWLTALQKTPDGTLWAGTFVGGLARLRPGATRWERLPQTDGQQVTALEPRRNSLLVATRQKVLTVNAPGTSLPAIHEAQALCQGATLGLWIGARTALYQA